MSSVKIIIIALLYFNGVVHSQNTCYTPNRELAQCIPIYHCRNLYNSIYNPNPQIQEFLRHSQCSFGRVLFVCCGSVAEYAKVQYQNKNPKKNRKPIRFPPNQNPNPKQHRNINLLPRYGQCGQQGLEDKIVGGSETGLDEFPWLALLGYKKDGKDVGFHCGGMLISERYVLTAAHCVTGEINRYYGNVYQVRLGEHDMRTLQDCTFQGECNDPPQDKIIEEQIFHYGFVDTSQNIYHDIALLRLRDPIRLSNFIQPICLPLNGERTTPGKKMSVAGWGRTEFGSRSVVKLKASVPYVDQAQCNNAHKGKSISDSQLCAGGQKGVDSCNGDSGGPIMNLLSDRETWYAEGLVSYGPENCGTENVPGVYTRIYSYLNWILDNMRP